MPAPLDLEVKGLSKHFGSLKALDGVDLSLKAATFHALLGENGAGKSTLVKCVMGYHQPDQGTILLGGVERTIASPMAAQELGIGMVYQHFTLVPSMTVEENLLLSRARLPGIINWKAERKTLDAFLGRMPFKIDRSAHIATLAAGERQKVEILKQLYVGSRIVLLDEPTSVLTPDEADQVLGTLREMVTRGELSVLLISHKLREVTRFADEVTILRLGRLAGTGKVGTMSVGAMTQAMIGGKELPPPAERSRKAPGAVKLDLRNLSALNDRGTTAVDALSLSIRAGEIVGIAGVSGNGQRELVEVLCGQRRSTSGELTADDRPYGASRAEMSRCGFHCLPEEPLRNACVASFSVEENLALREFDKGDYVTLGVLTNRDCIRSAALAAIDRFAIKTAGPAARVDSLSGGNIQRLVLARELSDKVQILVVANPCFGLDVKAIAEIRRRLMEARNAGAAILLVSEDLDEIFELADRICVMSEGRVVLEQAVEAATRASIGQAMTGHG